MTETKGTLLAVSLIVLLMMPAVITAQEYPGSFYYGESSNGNGIIGPEDIATLQSSLADLDPDYSGCEPSSSDIQELNGDGVIDPGDLSILQGWVLGDWENSDGIGIPFSAEVLTPVPSVYGGSSAELSIRLFDSASVGNGHRDLRSGWGVVFKVEKSVGGCSSALLYGRKLAPSITDPKDFFLYGDSVFNYTREKSAGAWASIRVLPEGCSTGDTIYISVSIPDDASLGFPSLKLPSAFSGPTIAVPVVDAPCTPDYVTSSVADIQENETQAYTLTMNCLEGHTTDVTTGSVISGDCSGGDGQITGDDVPCGLEPAGGCTITDTTSGLSTAVVLHDDESVSSVEVVPEGPHTVCEGDSLCFSCQTVWSDSCSSDCSSELSLSGGCGQLSGGCFSSSIACEAGIVAAVEAVSDSETVSVIDCVSNPPVISSVFPLDYADRFKNNAHMGQKLTVVMDLGSGGVPNSVSAFCGGVYFPCNLTGLPGDPDIVCSPGTPLTELSGYTCDITATNASGSDSAQGRLVTAAAAADMDGGFAGGYIGGVTYDSQSLSTGPGNIYITVINTTTNEPVYGKVYVRIVQGTTVSDYFTSPASGSLTVTLDPLPIDELTLGYKCGKGRCDKFDPADAYNDFQYITYHDVDASDLVVPLPLMPGAQYRRHKATIKGSLVSGYFDTYIYPQKDYHARKLLEPPVRTKAAIVTFTMEDLYELDKGLDAILMTPDREVSLSFCLTDTATVFDYVIKAALPPNVVVPEIRRQNWTAPCQSWGSNPGVYDYELYAWTPGEYKMMWSVGAYVNAANLNLSGSFDLFAFPLYMTNLGIKGITIPPALKNGDTVIDIGNDLTWSMDIRESWDRELTQSDSGAVLLGHDPDLSLDRKVITAINGNLPVDPARRDAQLRSGTYKVPNISDMELETKFGGAAFDDRFYRKNLIIATGGDFGGHTGLGITGLALHSKIDDVEFTTFQVGYIRSASTPIIGHRDLRYWALSASDSEVVSMQHAGPASSWGVHTGFDGTTIDFTAREYGGPVNYTAVVALTRGQFLDTPLSDPSMAPNSVVPGLEYNPGTIVSTWHIGPLEDWGNEIMRADEFLRLPEAISPPPDQYMYPGPQWSGTVGNSTPRNRNGELWRDRTVDTLDSIQSDASDAWGRLYFEFVSRGTMMEGNTAKTHSWINTLSESPITTLDGSTMSGWYAKRSARSKVESKYGNAYSGGYLQDIHPNRPYGGPHFISQGVKAGDVLFIDSRKHDVLSSTCDIIDVISESTIVTNCDWTNMNLLNDVDIRYKVLRQQAEGECLIDQSYGGGPSGYNCKSNTFWQAMGPMDGKTVRVHLPDISPGYTVLNGTTGHIPDIMDGLTGGSQLTWHFGVRVYNTDSWILGGLGGDFDWNNQDFSVTGKAQKFNSSDESYILYQ